MKIEDLELGAVFQPEWDARLIRVLAFDSEQVMYDSWLPHVSRWGIDSLSRRMSYYRIPTSFVLNKALYLRTEKYTEQERAVHRPDLPFSFARVDSLEWPMTCPATTHDFPQSLSQVANGEQELLDAPRIFLEPFGPKGGPKPSALVTAKNKKTFNVEEMLWHAARLQFQHLRDEKIIQGVGIYRSGVQRGLPSYYVWGAKSRMGI
ncbi:hypothetical protein O0882_14705 [Janthinobacterium sp. SUN073]|uniref:hypothetical protein n=1 Tax=Janthinobacterium sp. SUN073 TaxID=3004102 RepID=UPI0025B20462|nr:hypothetical protein [Janthinobacterium sp. SUN073]MDN2697571.1 hypothetical protein [Janthinobacterium sp. SUN073]